MKKLILISLLFGWCASTFANESGNIKNEANKTNVYEEIPEIISHKHSADKKVIRYYFSFTCPYCKQVHNFIDVWGKSLPPGLTYVATPVIDASESSRMLAAAYEYVKIKAPNTYYLDKFVTNIYSHIHKIGNTDELSRLIKESMVDAKVDIKSFIKTIGTKEFLEPLEALMEQQGDYDISVTPTVVVSGKYITHLGLAEGDPSRFIEILNAVANLQLYSSIGIK